MFFPKNELVNRSIQRYSNLLHYIDRRITKSTFIAGKTFYVYDDLGMLRYVIPPLATITTDGGGNSVLASGDLANLCYIYRYDKRQRMVVKKLPGADSVLMVYDKRDRLVGSQDGVQRAKSPREWMFIKL